MTHSWLAYLPSHLASDLLAHPERSPFERTLRTQAIALFADLSGFTPMSEALGQYGPAGTEELSTILNRTFGPLVSIIHAAGGSIGKFAGDALTVVFPIEEQRTKHSGPHPLSPAPVATGEGEGAHHPEPSASLRLCGSKHPIPTVRRAIQCALDMQASLTAQSTLATSAGPFRLTMKIGLGLGDLLTTTVGDPAIRLEYLLAGSAIDQCALAEQHASAGTVVATEDLVALMAAYESFPIAPGFRQITHMPALPHDPPLPLPLPNPDPTFIAVIGRYLPPVIVERLERGQQNLIDEHRTITTLFVHFAGCSYADDTAVAHLHDYLQAVVGSIDHYGGYLRQVEVGDKGSLFIALFGAPTMHEDDAERALRCALELRAMAQTRGIPTHSGIATGRVFCGLVGSPLRREYAAIGDTVNTAARLMSAAQRDQILVSETTRHVIVSPFRWAELPPLTVKGKREPLAVAALEMLQQRSPTRLQAPGYRLPMVGRTTEYASAMQLIAHVATGHGAVLTITGEAGMGKSRLIADILRQVTAQSIRYYTSECLSYGTQSSYLVWQPLLRALCGCAPELDPTACEVCVRDQLMAVDPILVEQLPLLNPVLGMQVTETPLTRLLDGKLRKGALEALVVQCLQYWTRQRPLLLILEDCHWLDDLSRDLLLTIADRLDTMPLLLILSARPSAAIPGAVDPFLHLHALPYIHQLTLTGFTDAEAAQLIALKGEQLSGDGGLLSPALITHMHDRTHGNPFYLDELLNFLHDRGIDLRDAIAFEQLELPDSLQRLIASRIDQLAEGPKQTLRVGSVIGRLFTASWLWEIAPMLGAPEQVLGQLDELGQRDFVQLERSQPERDYLFKHLLTQEVAYESLALSTRLELHEHIGAYIEQHYADGLEAWLDQLAYHYGASANITKQRHYFQQAARAATAAYAYRAAIGYYERLLPLLDGQQQIAATLDLCALQTDVGQWEEAERHARLALAGAEQQGNRALQARALHALGNGLQLAGFAHEAIVCLEQAREHFIRLGDQRALSLTLAYLGQAHAWLGQYEEALTVLKQSLTIATTCDDTSLRCSSLIELGSVYYLQGEHHAALGCYEQGLELAIALDHRAMQQMLHANLANTWQWLESYPRALEHTLRSLALAQQIGSSSRIELLLSGMGNTYGRVGQYTHAKACVQTSLLLGRRVANPYLVGWNLNQAGLYYSKCGQYDEAEQLFVTGRAVCQAFNQTYPLARYGYELAASYTRQQRYREAQASNDAALALAQQAGIKTALFTAQVLAIQLQVRLGQAEPVSAISALNALRAEWSSESQQARIAYTIWQIDPLRQDARQEATVRYRALALATHNIEYHERYSELTGDQLPNPPPLPAPPPLVMRTPVPIERLLARADDVLTEQARIAETAPTQ